MNVCDNCGKADASPEKSTVGPVDIEYKGWHLRHHTHGDRPWRWSADLCPPCAARLKDEISLVVGTFKRRG